MRSLMALTNLSGSVSGFGIKTALAFSTQVSILKAVRMTGVVRNSFQSAGIFSMRNVVYVVNSSVLLTYAISFVLGLYKPPIDLIVEGVAGTQPCHTI